MSDTRRTYFAYGSNLSVSQMAERCPLARLLGNAILRDHAFRIMRRGYATILPRVGADVHGVLWSLTRADEQSLDDYEGVHAGLYQKRSLFVGTSKSEVVEALVYQAADPSVGQPMDGYLEDIVAAAKLHGFPDEYVRGLVEWMV